MDATNDTTKAVATTVRAKPRKLRRIILLEFARRREFVYNEYHQAGKTLSKIAQEIGVSRERVRQLIRAYEAEHGLEQKSYRKVPMPESERLARSRAYEKARRQDPEVKAHDKEYCARPDVQARTQALRETDAFKKRERARRKTPKYRAFQHRYFARKRGLPDTFTADDWSRGLAYFKDRCAVCGRKVLYGADLFGSYTLAMDHWIPLTSPDCPGTVPWNIVPLCHGHGGCNNRKRNRNAHEWLMEHFHGDIRKVAQCESRVQRYFANMRNIHETFHS